MNAKGFTLVELLAIIVIIAVVMIIAAPNMTRQIKKSEEENQSVLNRNIENASKLYAAKYYANDLIKLTSSGDSIKFTLDDLEKDGLINLDDNECKEKDALTIKTQEIIISLKDDKINYNYDNLKSLGNCYK